MKKFIPAKNPLHFQVTILPAGLYPLYARGCVAVTCGARGIGKTSLVLAEALALASGEPLLGVQPSGKLRVWVHSSDETEDQMRRRLLAVAKRNDLPAYAVNSVFVTSGGTLLSREIEKEIHDQRFDCVILDSFRSSPNTLAHIADATDCALHVTTETHEGDRTLTGLTRAEARAAKIGDGERTHHFKASPERTIYRFEPVDGIDVVVTQDRAAFRLDDDFRDLMLCFLNGGPWRADRRSAMWLGYEIARELGLDASDAVVARQLQDAIDGWRREGVLESYIGRDTKRRPRTFLRVA